MRNHPGWEGCGSFIHYWAKRYGIVNKAVCGTKESAPGKDTLDDWVETVLLLTLAIYSPNDIYNGNETALFYKCLPQRTYCFGADKPTGSAKCKDRITFDDGWLWPQKTVCHRQRQNLLVPAEEVQNASKGHGY